MTEEGAGVRTQYLLDSAVRIHHGTEDRLVGTGVVVSPEGQILTCAHVVRDAGVDPRDVDGAEVSIHFPQVGGGEDKARQARVAACCPVHDDDIVLLQLVGAPPPLGPEQIAVLGTASPSFGHDFQSYGFSQLGKYPGRIASGKILSYVHPPDGKSWQVNPVQLESRGIRPGMSGAGVLDMERNLVVGLVAERWRPGDSTTDDDVGWAVDAYVLTFDPFNFSLREESLPLRPAPTSRLNPQQITNALANAARQPGVEWNGAPPPLAEWTGRADLLADLDRDWADPERRVTGLIGFGGEGKSSLARRWVENLLRATHLGGASHVPDGIFWWGFYDRPSVDEFFEAALEWLAGGRIDPRRLPGAGIRAQVIGAMLSAGRYLFVLDGLEVMQHQDGDQYGLLRSNDLRDFLTLFAAPGHGSFCLLTSRAPVLDLMAYTTYSHRDVERLSAADGRALLRNLGVQGPDGALDRVVGEWDGHALTLGLLGGYLADRHGGDVARIDDLAPPTAGEARYERVHRVLRRYDEHLTAAERAFLVLFSAFRTPVHESAFDRVFRQTSEVGRTSGSPETSEVWGVLAGLDDEAFGALVARLAAYRLLRHDAGAGTYTAHPLVRNHYFTQLTAGERAGQQDAHERIKDYYLDLAGDTPHFPSLDDLAPLIEVVHHACRAGAYDEADRILNEQIDQRSRKVLLHQLGAYETALALTLEFFPDGDPSGDPQVSDPKRTSFLLNRVGFCLMNLGRLAEAVPFYERAVTGYSELEDWHAASVGYGNLAELHAYLGALAASAEAAGQALVLARQAGNKQQEMISLAHRARAEHLAGEREAADASFRQAEVLEREINSSVRYLYSLRGIQHADHLRRSGRAGEARRVTEANLEGWVRNYKWLKDESQCHRILGDLDADASDPAAARAHYDRALEIARGISYRPALVEALLARGRWAARDPEGLENPQGLADLEEALGYALEGGYRIYEADARIGLAWAHLAAGDGERARAEAGRARGMSEEMGYYWGVVDADEVLSKT